MQLHAYLPYRIARLASLVGEATTKIYANRYGLSRDEWRILAAAGECEAQPTRLIAAQTCLDKVAISRAATSLEERRLIYRTENPTDRRIKILHLTPRGSSLLTELEQSLAERERQLTADLTEEEREALCTALDKMTLRAEALARADAMREAERLPEPQEARHGSVWANRVSAG